jgi:hypothetical protein
LRWRFLVVLERLHFISCAEFGQHLWVEEVGGVKHPRLGAIRRAVGKGRSGEDGGSIRRMGHGFQGIGIEQVRSIEERLRWRGGSTQKRLRGRRGWRGSLCCGLPGRNNLSA